MTASDLAELNGYASLLAADRARRGDKRDKSAIVNDILREHGAPDIGPLLTALTRTLLGRKIG